MDDFDVGLGVRSDFLARERAACDRGLSRNPGALGRSWLLQTKADGLKQKGKSAEAHRALEQALESAQQIPSQQPRENNIKRIKQALAAP